MSKRKIKEVLILVQIMYYAASIFFKESVQAAMPLDCAVTRPKLNILSFANPAACLDKILENQTYITYFNKII